MNKVVFALLIFASFAVAQNVDTDYWRQNSGAWGKQDFTQYVAGASGTYTVGPFMVWPYQTVNITVTDSAAVDVDSVKFSVNFSQWYNNTSASAVFVSTLSFQSHKTMTADTSISKIGTYSAILGNSPYYTNQFGWLTIRKATGQKVRPGILATIKINGYNINWSAR